MIPTFGIPWPFAALAYLGTFLVLFLIGFALWATFGAGLPSHAFGGLRRLPVLRKAGQARTQTGHHRHVEEAKP